MDYARRLSMEVAQGAAEIWAAHARPKPANPGGFWLVLAGRRRWPKPANPGGFWLVLAGRRRRCWPDTSGGID